ncbi:MAG: SIMPL domain-containing protein [Candidatus Colwellbacteria bacterium]|nr:SIMPL domain-containing protein [Candidatus Colwellbacteria bacterium]
MVALLDVGGVFVDTDAVTFTTSTVREWLKIAAFAAGIFALVLASGAVAKWGGSQMPARTIAVTGEARGLLSPDMARISFSVVTEGKDPARIQREGATKMNAAVAFVKERGVEAKDIATASYELYPKYAYEEKWSRSFIDGYTLTQTAEARVRQLDRVGEIVGGVVAAGANRVDKVLFEVEERDELLAPLYAAAIKNARAKAEARARTMGVRLDRVVTFSTSDSLPQPMPVYSMREGIGGGVSSPSPFIEPGRQEAIVYAFVTYEIW